MKRTLLLMALLGLTACDPKHGTGTGNPFSNSGALTSFTAVSVQTTCKKITSCHTGLTQEKCLEFAWPLDGFAPKLGISESPAPTALELSARELRGEFSPNSLFTSACINEINSLDCSDPVVVNSFDSESATPLAGAPALLGPSCNGVFSR